jgi:hypothetical protein
MQVRKAMVVVDDREEIGVPVETRLAFIVVHGPHARSFDSKHDATTCH